MSHGKTFPAFFPGCLVLACTLILSLSWSSGAADKPREGGSWCMAWKPSQERSILTSLDPGPRLGW
jgi:hypothetical protein